MAQMKGLCTRTVAGLALAILLAGVQPVARGAAIDVEFAKLQQEAEQLERANRWPAAARAYKRLTELQPQTLEWHQALRRCQHQDAISHRYNDASFRGKILSLSPERALELYAEVLNKIEANYADEVNFSQLFLRGLDNLDLALQNKAFLRASLTAQPHEEAVTEIRKLLLSRRTQFTPADRSEALLKVNDLANRLKNSLGAKQTAVIAEFACAACEALDEYSAYLTPDSFSEIYSVAREDYVGIGIDIQLVDGQVVVANVIPGGPAHKQGVLRLDRLIRIDNIATIDLGLEASALRLLGKPGTRVVIEVLHPSDGRPVRLDVVRQPVSSVLDRRMMDEQLGIGYVRLGFFQKTTPAELDLAIADLNSRGLRGLILDLRKNPGGSFPAAVQVADRFLPDGLITRTRGRMMGASMDHFANDEHNLTMPLIVLIDADSASASELVAGAIKDRGRGLLIGQKSYGKGAMQQVFPLDTVPAGIRMTTARFYSPIDSPFAEHGVVPHVVVERVEVEGMQMMNELSLELYQLQVAVQTARELMKKP